MSDQIASAANMMVRDYLILAFLVSLGTLQIAVTISGIRGLWLLPNRNLTRYLGILIIVVGIAYYILSPIWIEGPWAAGSVIDGTSENREWGTAVLSEISGARNLNDIHGGMAGTAYAIYFVASAVLATLFAAVIGAINIRRSRSTSYRASETIANSPSFRRKPAACGTERPSRGDGGSEATSRPLCPSDISPVNGGNPGDGLDALANTDAFSTLITSLRNLRKNGLVDVRNEIRSAHRWSIPSIIGKGWRD